MSSPCDSSYDLTTFSRRLCFGRCVPSLLVRGFVALRRFRRCDARGDAHQTSRCNVRRNVRRRNVRRRNVRCRTARRRTACRRTVRCHPRHKPPFQLSAFAKSNVESALYAWMSNRCPNQRFPSTGHRLRAP
jgi:hypothetical protein